MKPEMEQSLLACIAVTAYCMLCAYGEQTCKTLTTFNTGLMVPISGYSERRMEIGWALRDNDADVYCLQEVWFESDIDQILIQTEDVYPYHFSPIHDTVGVVRKPVTLRNWWQKLSHSLKATSACTLEEASYLSFMVGGCALVRGCITVFMRSPVDGVGCIAHRCADLLKSERINAACISCTVISSTDFMTPALTCGPNLHNRHNRMNPSGLLVLSKSPLTSVRYERLHEGDMVTERGTLAAHVAGLGKVVCTHLTYVFPVYFEYDQPFYNYMEMLVDQMTTLDRRFGASDHVLMGDLNTSPVHESEEEERGLVGEYPELYEALLAMGYRTPYFEHDGRCTYCKDNELGGSSDNTVLDYILVKGNKFSVRSASRVLRRTIRFPFSDHYGVRAEVCIGDV